MSRSAASISSRAGGVQIQPRRQQGIGPGFGERGDVEIGEDRRGARK